MVLLPFALFGAAVLLALFLYWQGTLPQKYQRAIETGLRTYSAELHRQERR